MRIFFPVAVILTYKCFDTTDHNILLYKLDKCGLNGNKLGWFKSYLSSRRQVVKIQNYTSNEFSLGVGIPQGSALGPLLYLLFANNL